MAHRMEKRKEAGKEPRVVARHCGGDCTHLQWRSTFSRGVKNGVGRYIETWRA